MRYLDKFITFWLFSSFSSPFTEFSVLWFYARNNPVQRFSTWIIAFDVRRTLRNLWGSCGRWDTCACQAWRFEIFGYLDGRCSPWISLDYSVSSFIFLKLHAMFLKKFIASTCQSLTRKLFSTPRACRKPDVGVS